MKKIITYILIISLLIVSSLQTYTRANSDYDADDIWREDNNKKYIEVEYDNSYDIKKSNIAVRRSGDNTWTVVDGITFYVETKEDNVHYSHDIEGRVYLDGKLIDTKPAIKQDIHTISGIWYIEASYITELNREYYAYLSFYDKETGEEEKIAGVYFVLYEPLTAEKTVVQLEQIEGKEAVRISWDTMPDVQKYSIYRQKEGKSGFSLLKDNLKDTSFIDSAVVEGRKYTYYVTTKYNDNSYSDSDKVDIMVKRAIEEISSDESGDNETTIQETETEKQTKGPVLVPPIQESTMESTWEHVTNEETQEPTTQKPTMGETSREVPAIIKPEETTAKVKINNHTQRKKSVKLMKPKLKIKKSKKNWQIYWGMVTDKSRGIEVYMKNGIGKYRKYRKIYTITNLKKSKNKKGVVGISSSKKSLIKNIRYKFRARTFTRVKGKKIYSKWSNTISIKR